MRARTLLILTGLLMKSTAPSARPRASEASSLWALTKMTGMLDVTGLLLSRLQTS